MYLILYNKCKLYLKLQTNELVAVLLFTFFFVCCTYKRNDLSKEGCWRMKNPLCALSVEKLNFHGTPYMSSPEQSPQ
jgi:hypothetical protein